MSFSDILALLEILVTILFGYYIMHWVTVRDTRTRSVKELYLNRLSDIKKQVDLFFSDLFDGKLDWREVADWYGHQQSALTSFDDGLRLALPVRKRKLEDIVNDIHETVTGSEFYNDSYNNIKYVLNNDEKSRILAVKEAVDKAFNEYVVQINNSRQYYFWETIKQNFNFDKAYFIDENYRNPFWEAFKIRFWKSLPYVLALVIFLLLVKGTYNSYHRSIIEENRRQESFVNLADKAFERIDLLNETIKDISKRRVKGCQAKDSCQFKQLTREKKQDGKILNK